MVLDAPVAISLGFVGVYLVPADGGCALVDAGVPGSEHKIFAGLAQHGLAPESIRLIVVTHAHGDHMGSVQAIARHTQAPVLASRLEAPAIERGRGLHPRGLTPFGKLFALVMIKARWVEMASEVPCPVDVVVDDELSLAAFGVAGRALHTPGHTAGSVSLLLDSGDAFVGDLCAKLPLIGGSHVPFFADLDRATIYASWQRLLDAGATRIWPDHGAPFAAEELRRELARVRRA
ncbi:MAG: MBL fold metallo-hydrolase [Chloroflexota bacterium]